MPRSTRARSRSAKAPEETASTAETVQITQLDPDAEPVDATRSFAEQPADPEQAEAPAAAEVSAEELLSIPPRADNLAEELAARPQRTKPPKLTLALSAGVLIAAGFVGGVLAQKHYGTASGGTGRAARASPVAGRGAGAGAGTGAAGRGGFGGFGGGAGSAATGGFGGSSITGSITVVSGDTLYITSTTGTVYTVKTSGTTTVKLSSSGSLSQLKPGQTVTISGTQGSGGTVTATTITAGN
jgi:hypothetical protein